MTKKTADQTPTAPIFLIGAARSGTKFARSILAASEATAAIEYDVNYIWRYGNEKIEHDELDIASLTPKIKKHIRNQLDRLAGISEEAPLTLVEKTVSSTLRIPFIDAIYPEARYIHLMRDGRAVTESSMRMWQAPPDTGSLFKKLRQMPWSSAGYVAWFGYNFVKGLVTGRGGGQVWGPRYNSIMSDIAKERPLVEICALQWQRSIDNACEDLKSIDPKNVFTLSYNDLVGSEDRILEMLDFAGIEDKATVMEHYHATVRGGNDEKWRERLNDDDKDKMLSLITPTLERLNFLPDISNKIKTRPEPQKEQPHE